MLVAFPAHQICTTTLIMQVNEAYGIINLTPGENIYDKPVLSGPEIMKKKEKKCRFQVVFLCLVSILAIILAASAIIIALATNLGQLSDVTCHSCSMTDTNATIKESTSTATKPTTEPTAQVTDESALTNSTTTTKTSTTTTVELGTTTPTATTTKTTTRETMISPAALEHCGDLNWRRVAFINMTDQTQNCPQGLNETSYSIRSCGRPASGNRICYSAYFSVDNTAYNKVCGRVLAYRFGRNIGFYGYNYNSHGFNDQYVDGISLTHGTGAAKTHIWTFVSGIYQSEGIDRYVRNRCPCDPGNTYSSPPFVGNDYFCESVLNASDWNINLPYLFYPDNPLWDGQGCGSNNNCCQFNTPPWFKKILANSTSQDIELRLCHHHPFTIGNIAIEQLEIYVAD